MIPYETIFEHYRACAAAWAAEDTDAGMALEESATRLSTDETAEFVEEFCSRAGDHVEEVGPDLVGEIIWYVMGAGEQVWHTVREASPQHAGDAVRSLQLLYERCFAKQLKGWSGPGGEGSRLAGACYMLWDMDGGLESIPLFGTPKALVPVCYEVLEHALSLDSPACWESALHGLGHIIFSHRDPGTDMIGAFLKAKGSRVPNDLREYAALARTGGAQ